MAKSIVADTDAIPQQPDGDKRPSGDEIHIRMEQIAHSCYAIHSLTIVAEGNDDHANDCLVAIREMARANAKGLEACLNALESNRHQGNFSYEFDLI